MTATRTTTEFVKSLGRGLAVIRAFDSRTGPMTLSEVADKVSLPPVTAGRILQTMVGLGYVRRAGCGYRLDAQVLELGFRHISDLSLPEIARPSMESLVRQVGESSSMAVLADTEIEYVARVQAKAIMTVAIDLGTRFPAYLTSMGRVLLAASPGEWFEEYLERAEFARRTNWTVTEPDRLRTIVDGVRADGFSLVDQELEPALRSIAVPVHDARDGSVAAMNISAHATHRGTAEMLGEILPALRAGVAEIERELPARSRSASGPKEGP